MNPDFDDYDDVNNDQGDEEGRTRTLPRLVLILAIVGFLGLAVYAYTSGKDAVAPGDLATIEADLSAIKERPVDPEGEEFPHKDKTIYDAISPYEGDTGEKKVEKLLPEPEEPVKPAGTIAAAPESDAKTWVNESLRQQETPEEAVKAAVTPPPAAEVKPVASTPEPVKDEPVKTVEAPKPVIVEKPPVNAVTKPVEKPVEKPAPTTASGNFKIQLGAFKTEAEAQQTWSKIVAKNGDVLSGKPQSIAKADLPNGTYYRLRVSGFATADAAKSACATLSARKQGCFFAGK